MGTKHDRNPAGKTLNPMVPLPESEAICNKLWSPKGLCGSAPTLLLVVVAPTASVVGDSRSPLWFFSDKLYSWILHPSRVSTAPLASQSQLHTLPSQEYACQPLTGFLLKPGYGGLPDTKILILSMCQKSSPRGWSQGVQPVGSIARFPSLLAVEVKCLDFWVLWTQFWGIL